MATGPPTVDRWMLPGELVGAADLDHVGPARRTPRDWIVDVCFFLASVGFLISEYSTTVVDDAYGLPDWLRLLDPVLGVALCATLWWRRRFPLALGVVAMVVAAGSNTATGAVLVLLFSLALHRGWTHAVPVAALGFPLGLPYVLTYFPRAGQEARASIVILVLLVVLVVTAGLAVRARRQLVLVLRRTYRQRLDDSRRDERERIAREMHDTLAHRISLLSVHAGALEYRTESAAPLTPEEVRAAVGVMRSNAHQALEELRDVLQVLRGGVGDGATEPPQPTADAVPTLLAEARDSGQRVVATVDGDLAALRPQVQRTVHRLVQEGLTNARKHAPDAEVTVAVRAEPDRDVEVLVCNAAGAPGSDVPSGIPGAGAGLTGLAERVALHGGELTHGIADGRFRLTARIPWAP